MLVREAMERFERGLVAEGASRNTVATYKRNLERFVEDPWSFVSDLREGWGRARYPDQRDGETTP